MIGKSSPFATARAVVSNAGVMAPALWVLAVVSTMTVIHRITYTYQQTRHLAPLKAKVVAEPTRESLPSTVAVSQEMKPVSNA
jgi:hypothetical protein